MPGWQRTPMPTRRTCSWPRSSSSDRTHPPAVRTWPLAIRAEALDHLDRVRPRNPSMAVMFHLCRGDALNRLMRFDEAEAAWLEALRIDPTAPEVGWNLLTLYYVQGREEEARRLALRLYRVEPDPHDRASLLLELLRRDVRTPAPGSIEKILEPVVRQNPGDFYSGLAMGLALTRANKVELGIDQLRRVVQTHPDRVEAWDGLLTGLDESGQVDVMEEELERLPAALSEAPRLLKHRARIAQDANRWNEAVDLFRRARPKSPTTASSSTGLAEPCGMWARQPRPIESKSAFTAARRLYRSCARCSTRLQRPQTWDPSAPGALPADRPGAGAHAVARGGHRLASTRIGG